MHGSECLSAGTQAHIHYSGDADGGDEEKPSFTHTYVIEIKQSYVVLRKNHCEIVNKIKNCKINHGT